MILNPKPLKHAVFILCLKISRALARGLQIGNPARKAPRLTVQPTAPEEVFRLNDATEPVIVWQLRRVLVSALYGGAILNQHNRVYRRFLSFPWGKALHPALSSPYLGRQRAPLRRAIFLLTPEAKGNYYHWMTDLLPRLLLIRKSNPRDVDRQAIILHHPPAAYEADTLALLNIPARHIVRLKPFETVPADCLIVADYYDNTGGFPRWKRHLLDEFKQQAGVTCATDEPCDKIYLFRGNQRKRRLIGEDRLVEVLKERGFRIIDPQHLSLSEQIERVARAKVVVALHGAALTNLIFCREGTQVVELRSTINPPEHYAHLAETYRLRFETVSVPPEQSQRTPHLANKQNLVLSDQNIRTLLKKLTSYEKVSR